MHAELREFEAPQVAELHDAQSQPDPGFRQPPVYLLRLTAVLPYQTDAHRFWHYYCLEETEEIGKADVVPQAQK